VKHIPQNAPSWQGASLRIRRLLLPLGSTAYVVHVHRPPDRGSKQVESEKGGKYSSHAKASLQADGSGLQRDPLTER